VINYKL